MNDKLNTIRKNENNHVKNFKIFYNKNKKGRIKYKK